MERELSPFSARRLLTQKLAAERNGGSQHSSVSRDHSRDTSVQNGKRDQPPKEPSVASGSPSKSRTESIRPNDTSSDRNLQRKVPSTTEAGAPRGPHDPSPEPYRRPRASSREIERKRDKSPDRKRNSSRDRRRDRPRDRSRDRSRGKLMDRSRDRKRDTSREKRRSRSREGRRGHSRDRRRDGSREKDSAKDKRRDRSADKHRHGHSRRHRSRSRDSHRKDRERDTRRSRSPLPYRSRKQRTRSPSASTSPPPKRRRRTRSPSRSPHRRVKKPLPSQEVSFRGLDDSAQPPSKYGGAPPNKERPNFNTTGMLAKHANRVEGTKISLKYHEPAEARKPPSSQPWRMFVFKGDDVVDTIELAQKSCWLLGRSHEVVDYVLEHPSSSGQHAVIQFRYIQKTVEDEFGVKSQRGKVKPYVIDLESSNGTELNGETVEASRYFELRDKDILKFAGCEREYVIMLPPPEAR